MSEDETRERLLGLMVEYEPKGREPDVDIIAVHGLGARWPWKREVTCLTGEKRYVNWLADTDMLPSHIPNARIMTFNYESRWISEAPQQTLWDCGNELILSIRRARAERTAHKVRPIIFIGHSLGGIVVEQAIVIAIQHGEPMLGDFDLLALTAGFIFLGTPFRGSGLASAGQLFASVAAYLGFVTELRILGALGQTSEILEGLRHTFCSWQRTYQIPCFCFHEKLKTLYWSIFGWSIAVMVVPKDSACLDGVPREGLYADHLKIAKYGDPHNSDYLKVCYQLTQLVTGALSTVRKHRRAITTGIKTTEHEIPAQVLFDEPVIFRDAHGCTKPVHTQTIASWEVFEFALINSFMAKGLKGAGMIRAGDYSLTNMRTSRDHTRQEAYESVFRPGLVVSMNMLFRDLETSSSQCPGCGKTSESVIGEVVTCKVCNLTYRLQETTFVPQRAPEMIPERPRGRRSEREDCNDARSDSGVLVVPKIGPTRTERPGDFVRVTIDWTPQIVTEYVSAYRLTDTIVQKALEDLFPAHQHAGFPKTRNGSLDFNIEWRPGSKWRINVPRALTQEEEDSMYRRRPRLDTSW